MLFIKIISSLVLFLVSFCTSVACALEVGDMHKDFALRDATGQIVTLSDIRDDARVTILEFISVYCDGCEKKTARINKIVQHYAAQGVRVLAVALANEQPEVNAIRDSWGITYPLWADPDKITYYLYGVRRVPLFFMIDSSGIIRYRGNAKNFKDFEKELTVLLQESEIRLNVGDLAPEFELPDRRGHITAIRFIRTHQNTILGFFTSSDKPNQHQGRALAHIYQGFQKNGLKVFGVFSSAFSGDIEKFIRTCSIDFPVLIDTDTIVFNKYSVSQEPELVIINETGRVKKRVHSKTYDELIELFTQAKQKILPKYSEQQAVEFLRRELSYARTIKPFAVGDETIYIGIDNDNNKFVARFIQKDVICEVCSDVHFVYTMNEKGVYRDIVLVAPFELYGKPIDATDFIAQFRGKSLHDRFKPGSNVDVISGATKSCIKLIEGLNETEKVFANYLKDPSFESKFKASVCYMEQADLERALQFCSRVQNIPQKNVTINKIAAYCPGKKLPHCPSGGIYKIIIFNDVPRITCSLHGLDPQSSTYSLR